MYRRMRGRAPSRLYADEIWLYADESWLYACPPKSASERGAHRPLRRPLARLPLARRPHPSALSWTCAAAVSQQTLLLPRQHRSPRTDRDRWRAPPAQRRCSWSAGLPSIVPELGGSLELVSQQERIALLSGHSAQPVGGTAGASLEEAQGVEGAHDLVRQRQEE